jgi:hypothetical protein
MTTEELILDARAIDRLADAIDAIDDVLASLDDERAPPCGECGAGRYRDWPQHLAAEALRAARARVHRVREQAVEIDAAEGGAR